MRRQAVEEGQAQKREGASSGTTLSGVDGRRRNRRDGLVRMEFDLERGERAAPRRWGSGVRRRPFSSRPSVDLIEQRVLCVAAMDRRAHTSLRNLHV